MNEISNFLIKRRSGQEIKVFFDKEDLEKVIKYKWQYHSRGPVYPLIRGKKYLFFHKFVLENKIVNPIKEYVYFKNGNQFDCRKENLSIGKNNRENLYLLRRRKQLKIKENGKIEGVYFDSKKQAWQTYIKLNKKQYSQFFSLVKYNNLAKEKAIECRKYLIFLGNYDLLKYFIQRKQQEKKLQNEKNLKKTIANLKKTIEIIKKRLEKRSKIRCCVYLRNKDKWNEKYICIIRFNNFEYHKDFPIYKTNALENAYKYKEKLENYSKEEITTFFNNRNEKLLKRGNYRKLTKEEYNEVTNLLPKLELLINKRVNKWIPNGMLSFGDFRQDCLIDFINKKYSIFKDEYGGNSEESQILEKWFTRFITFKIKSIRSKIFNWNHTRKSLTSANEESARWKGNTKNKEESQITILSTLENPAPSEIDFDFSIKELDRIAKIEFTKEEFEIYQNMKNDENFVHSQTKNIRAKLLEIIRENDLVLGN